MSFFGEQNKNQLPQCPKCGGNEWKMLLDNIKRLQCAHCSNLIANPHYVPVGIFGGTCKYRPCEQCRAPVEKTVYGSRICVQCIRGQTDVAVDGRELREHIDSGGLGVAPQAAQALQAMPFTILPRKAPCPKCGGQPDISTNDGNKTLGCSRCNHMFPNPAAQSSGSGSGMQSGYRRSMYESIMFGAPPLNSQMQPISQPFVLQHRQPTAQPFTQPFAQQQQKSAPVFENFRKSMYSDM